MAISIGPRNRKKDSRGPIQYGYFSWEGSHSKGMFPKPVKKYDKLIKANFERAWLIKKTLSISKVERLSDIIFFLASFGKVSYICNNSTRHASHRSAHPGGAFFLYMTVPFTKSPTTVQEQIVLLQNRGLIIDDPDYAKHYLSHIGYYRLAGYWQIFQTDRKKHIFKAGITIQEIIDLYDFDRELRLLLLDAIERIEVSFRAILSDTMSCQHGRDWFAEGQHFHNLEIFDSIIDEIEKELKRSTEEFICHHDKTYGADIFPPSWMTLQVLSFGTLSKIYGNIKNEITETDLIAKKYGLASKDWLHSWIQVLSVLRNYCAHHCRICYRIFSYPPKLMRKPKLAWIKNYPPPGGQESQLLYYQLCAVKYLLHTCSPKNSFSKKLKSLIEKYPSIDLVRMGFFDGWENEPIWRD